MRHAVKALLRSAIDYAGLFPPAALDLERTVENYAAYRAGGDGWALGRLVIPASSVAEFADRWPDRVGEWPISLVLGRDYDSELRLAVDAGMKLDCVECKPAKREHIAEIRKRLSSSALLFVEAPAGVPVEDLLAAIADVDACAKVRTGGVTADAIPGTRAVADFLTRCAATGSRIKATAGLHHAIRGEYRLTYEQDSSKARMHGFVNFFVAAALAGGGGSEADADAILADSNPASFSASNEEIRWRDKTFSAEAMEMMRENLALSFGSCSFEEPLAELRAMGWIE